MTFHFGSVVEFGLFFTRISESLLSGASLFPSVELIRAQLHGVAAAVRVEDRFDRRQGTVIIAEADARCGSTDPACDDMLTGTREEARLAELLETCHSVTASTYSEVDDVRFTLWVFRERSEPAFDDEEGSVCEILASQLRRGAEMSRRLGASETERSLYSGVMDRLSVGVVILDLNGRVVRCSAKAEEALAARDGLQLQAGKLRATSAREDKELQEAIKAATQAASAGEKKSGRGLALTRPSGCRNLGIIIQSVPTVHEDGVSTAPMVAIYIRDPEANADVENDLVRQLFDLTPAEAAVARRLAAGLSLEDAASSLDISRNTARAHLRSIFSKSGITRQTELVRLMLNSAVVLGEPARQVA